jgi:hypothetical protein
MLAHKLRMTPLRVLDDLQEDNSTRHRALSSVWSNDISRGADLMWLHLDRFNHLHTPYDHSTDFDTNLNLGVRAYSIGAMNRGGGTPIKGGTGSRALQGISPNTSHDRLHCCHGGDNMASQPPLGKTLISTTCPPSRTGGSSEIWVTVPEQRPTEATSGCEGKGS